MSSAFEGLPKTPNLKLNKPGYDNVADIEALNENADILDEEIQGIKNTFVKSVNGINAGDDGNVDLGIIPISQGGTGQTTASGVRNALGLGNTTGALPIANGGTGATTAANARTNLGLGNVATLNTVPIANGGTGATTVAGARNNLGLGNTNGALPIANGGTGATTAKQARTNLGIDIDVDLSEATLLWENPSPNSDLSGGLKTLAQPYTNFKKLLTVGKTMSTGGSYLGSDVIDTDVLTELLAEAKAKDWSFVQLAYTCGAGIYLSVPETTTTQLYYSANSGSRLIKIYGYK